MFRIGFDFDHRKTTQAINFFARRAGGQINKMKALKLVYFADRYHLRKYGRLVTNDTYFAMRQGPVPSGGRDIVEGSSFLDRTEREYADSYLKKIGRYALSSIRPIDNGVFSDSDIEALQYTWRKLGGLDQYALARLTHHYPEWSKHESALEMRSRIQMSLVDFLDEPRRDVEKCFALTDQDRGIRREQLEDMARIDALWS